MACHGLGLGDLDAQHGVPERQTGAAVASRLRESLTDLPARRWRVFAPQFRYFQRGAVQRRAVEAHWAHLCKPFHGLTAASASPIEGTEARHMRLKVRITLIGCSDWRSSASA